MRMINKRGLSNIVATVLIVLLSLAAVVIVWGFLRPVFDTTSSKAALRSACLMVTVEPTQCTISGNSATVAYQLKTAVPNGVTLANVVVVVEDRDGITYVNPSGAAPNGMLQSQTAEVVSIGTASPFVARVAAILRDASGNKETCSESVQVAC